MVTYINYEARPYLINHNPTFSVSCDTEEEAIQEIIARLQELGQTAMSYGIFKQTIVFDGGTCVSNTFEQLLPCPLEKYSRTNLDLIKSV